MKKTKPTSNEKLTIQSQLMHLDKAYAWLRETVSACAINNKEDSNPGSEKSETNEYYKRRIEEAETEEELDALEEEINAIPVSDEDCYTSTFLANADGAIKELEAIKVEIDKTTNALK